MGGPEPGAVDNSWEGWRSRGNACPGRSRGNVSPAVSRRALLRRQLFLVDMNDNLIAVAARPWIESALERTLSNEGKSVGAHFADWRFVLLLLCVELVARRVERLHQDFASLRRQTSPDHEHAVLVDVRRHVTRRVAQLVVVGLDCAVDPPPASHHLLDLRRGSGPAQVHQRLLGIRRGNTGERPHLGVGEFALAHCLAHQGQVTQGSGDSHPLTGRAGGQPDPPGQPVRAREKAAVPAFLFIELADQDEQFIGRRVDARSERGDLFAHTLLGAHAGLFFNHLVVIRCWT